VVAFDLGGPVVNLSGAQLPVPYPVARFRYGVTDRLNLNVGGHLLMPAFGDLASDAGASYHFLDQDGWRPCLGVGAGGIGLVEFDGGGGTAFLPQLELTASYLRPDHSLSYFSVGRNLSVSFEMKWYAASQRAKPRAVIYSLPIANHGGLGFVAGVSYHLGGWYR